MLWGAVFDAVCCEVGSGSSAVGAIDGIGAMNWILSPVDGMPTTMSGMVAGIGCAAHVVVLRAGANTSSSMASQLNGQMPVLQKALLMVVFENAFSHARE